jgi:mannose-6-phosphate isomerase-like protein (cupin superfamily)
VREIELACQELGPALDLLKRSGLRLDVIYPAEDPHTALLSKDGESVRLTSAPGAPPPSDDLPTFRPEFVLTRAGGGSGEGRAGMLYRDLIPGRLGGRYIASHISIPGGGPVSDWVHYHRVRFQMIYVRSGWVRVVYEDQGEPFVMEAGDLVLQPPEIRHRVLESSPGLEVIEVSCPAEHPTFAEHQMELPNPTGDPERSWSGQHFLRHVASETPWTAFLSAEAQETGIHEATGGIAQVRTIRGNDSQLAFPPHAGELVFLFVLEGNATLHFRGSHPVTADESFVIPPGEPWTIDGASDDLRLLHVTSAAVE